MRLSLLLAMALPLAACGSAPATPGPPLAAASAPAAPPPIRQEGARVEAVLMTEAVAANHPDAIGRSIGGGFKLICWLAPAHDTPLPAGSDSRLPPGHALGMRDLSEFGLTADQATALAEANLHAGLRPAESVLVAPPRSGIVAVGGDFAEAGRLALFDQWGPLAGLVDGELLVAAPAADTLIYIDGREVNAVRRLFERARVLMAKSPRPLSASVLRWSPTGWQAAAPSS